MSILKELNDAQKWQELLAYKIEKSHLTKKDEAFLRDFIESENYKPITENILHDDFSFSIPEKKLLNKTGKAKKRVVYTFSDTENTVLKLVAYLLYRYDDFQPRNCYSFRRHYGAKKAIDAITSHNNLPVKYSCKLDIKNYFNSIDVELLLPILFEVLSDDKPLYLFFERLLTADNAVLGGEVISEKRGAMAGTPISQFFANIYLAEMDRFFLDKDVLYARYSDDIIFFADSKELLGQYQQDIKYFLTKYKLEINPEKVSVTEPHEKWDYLGIAYDNGRIGLSDITMKKIKGKIRRKARAIYRWKNKKDCGGKKAMQVYARSINRKFFGKDETDSFTWARWFLPLITDADDLKIIDAYNQEYMRYVSSGRFNSANYRIRYFELKECGYRSLVNEYHRYLKGKPFTLNSQ